jgi:putative endonuclease
MTEERLALGRAGQDAAEAYLRGRRYRIVERNYRCVVGEVDLIAVDRGTVVFVEVKTRRGHAAGSGLEAVDARKQRQLTRTAQHYLQRHGLLDRPSRFDVVAVFWREEGAVVEHIENAFDAAI